MRPEICSSKLVRGWVLAAAALALLVQGCSKQTGPMTPPPANVTVMYPVKQDVSDWEEFPGRLQSPQSTSIQARISGMITETPFKEGSLVKQGDVLFVIDDRPFKADLDNKIATVAKDQAQCDLTNAQLARSQRLLSTHVVDQQDYDIAQANYRQAQAQLAADQAAQEASALNFEWTRVKAPIAGRVSKINVTVGNQITGGVGNGTELTTIVSVDPMYCYVPVPERLLLEYQKYAASQGETVRKSKIACSIQLENETGFPHKGMVDFIDNAIDPATGTVQVRGLFQNPDGYLNSGQFARMRIEGGGASEELLVPDEAIQTEQNEKSVLVVTGSDTVNSVNIQPGLLVGTMRVITSVNPGEITDKSRVIVDGIQMARPKAKVNAQFAAQAETTPPPGAATGSGS
jgi:membrane fusion protein, multidrug efflux system